MSRNHLIGLSAAIAALGLLAFLAWTFLEIYPRQSWVGPSREARTNEYLALDRWLQGLGHPVRLRRSGNLSAIEAAEERQIFIQASLFSWTPEAAEALARRVTKGGRIFIALDYSADWEFRSHTDLLSLLETFGIEARMGSTVPWHHHDAETPAFGHDFSFETLHNDNALTLEDWTGLTRLVQVNHGAGSLIVSGRPRFLLSPFIADEPNARLAWTLFAETGEAGEKGWLFIRGTTRTQGLWGSLFRHGNLGVVAVSALALLVVGFWAAIPLFGLVRRDDERPEKPLRERFAAEGRFFKTYGALGVYRDAYVKEIRRRLAGKEGLSADDKVTGRVLEALGTESTTHEGRLIISALRKEPIAYRDFPKMLIIFKTILERI